MHGKKYFSYFRLIVGPFLIIRSQLAMLQGHLGHSILPSLCLLCNELLAKIKSLITSAIFGHEKQGLDYKDFSKERHDTL